MTLYYNYLRNYKIPFLIAVLCVTLEAVCDLLGPTLMARIINQGIEKGSLTQVYYWGALITRMTNDTSQIIQFVNGMMRIFLKAPLTGIGSVILASWLNFRLSLIIYGVVAVVALLIYASMKFSYPRFYQLQKAVDRVNLKVQEYLIGIRLVKAFGTYEQETEKFAAANRELMQKGISSQMVITVISPFLTLVVGTGTAAVIYWGSRLFVIELAELGDMMAFTIYMAQILTSLIMITTVFTTFVRTKASMERIGEVLDCAEDFAPSGKERKLQGKIGFDKVTFAYPNGSGVPAIQELSFTVNPGGSLAIIGPTGSGKSTVAWLLLRFYDADSGRVMLDDYLIQELGVDEIRHNIAIVPQKPMLFSGTVAENLRWGDKQASPEQLRQAAERVQADFIGQMTEGYDSLLGSEGVNLSGGQKQRLSLARAILKKAPVLILDDVTSALDAVTEAKVRGNLKHNDDRQTLLIITQRCGTAMSADRILVMENGRPAGLGSHEELMRTCSIYQDIYHTQLESSREA